MDTETQLSVPKPRGNRPGVVQNGTLVIVVQAERKMRKHGDTKRSRFARYMLLNLGRCFFTTNRITTRENKEKQSSDVAVWQMGGSFSSWEMIYLAYDISVIS